MRPRSGLARRARLSRPGSRCSRRRRRRRCGRFGLGWTARGTRRRGRRHGADAARRAAAVGGTDQARAARLGRRPFLLGGLDWLRRGRGGFGLGERRSAARGVLRSVRRSRCRGRSCMPRRLLARRLRVLRKPPWVGARPGIRLRLGARAARRRLLGRGGRDWRVRRRSACDRGRRTRRCRSRCRGRRSSRRQPRRPDGRPRGRRLEQVRKIVILARGGLRAGVAAGAGRVPRRASASLPNIGAGRSTAV